MSKMYICSKDCGSVEETDSGKIPICCGCEMREIKKEEIFGCPGCAACHLRCNEKQGDNVG